jgi:hypothetical protein
MASMPCAAQGSAYKGVDTAARSALLCSQRQEEDARCPRFCHYAIAAVFPAAFYLRYAAAFVCRDYFPCLMPSPAFSFSLIFLLLPFSPIFIFIFVDFHFFF